MKIICAPDSFKDSLSSVDAANAMASGIRQVAATAEVDCCPIGDGGEGTLAALLAATDGRAIQVDISDAFGDDIDAEFGLFEGGKLAFAESAQCIGLQLIPPEQRNPLYTTSFGVGELIQLAAEAGVRRVVVGLGGTATCDGGCGMAQALGYRFFDRRDDPVNEPLTGAMLESIGRIDATYVNPILSEVEIIAACDVTNPLLGSNGAARVFGPQKGADDAQVQALDAGLAHLASIVESSLGSDVRTTPGGGAAGGLGAGLLAFTHARIQSGIEFVLDAVNFHERVRGCDLWLTGEGRLDRQSVNGKACTGVARAAAARNVPTIALVGAVGDGVDLCLDTGISGYREIGAGISEEQSRANAADLLQRAAADEVRKLT